MLVYVLLEEEKVKKVTEEERANISEQSNKVVRQENATKEKNIWGKRWMQNSEVVIGKLFVENINARSSARTLSVEPYHSFI